MTPREWEAPASFGQERIWLADQMDPGSPVFNLQCSFVVPHPLEPDQVLAALRVLTERHEVLRTSFRLVDGVLHQVVHAEVDLDVRMHDLRALPVEEARTEAYDLAVAATGAAIPTGRAPLWWVTAIRTENARWVINFVIHHAVFDATSAVILERETIEVCAAAACRPADLPELPIQYADYAAWQRGQLTGPVLTEQTDHWRSRLTGLPAVHPPHRPATAGPGSATLATRSVSPSPKRYRSRPPRRDAARPRRRSWCS
ncbi:condensation domain-containing protein [Streptosporangium lutulentum]